MLCETDARAAKDAESCPLSSAAFLPSAMPPLSSELISRALSPASVILRRDTLRYATQCRLRARFSSPEEERPLISTIRRLSDSSAAPPRNASDSVIHHSAFHVKGRGRFTKRYEEFASCQRENMGTR